MKRLPPEQRLALTVEEAAALAGVSRSQGYARVKAGDWPSVRVGKEIRVPRRPFEALFDGAAGERGVS